MDAGSDDDRRYLRRAVELARRGLGAVEPNPVVGCVIVRDGQLIAEGWHPRFGGPHAEIEALRVAGEQARGATIYVTLEPCCHFGKTPPCTQAIIGAGVRRVVVGGRDPFPAVAGQGIDELRAAGLIVDVIDDVAEVAWLNAPFCKRIERGRPWIIAKWAMSADGKMATSQHDSRWISCETSRALVHRWRGEVDAIMVGSATARHDDPLLTARPAGPRVATRIVVDSQASLSLTSQLVRTARDVPLLVAVGPNADPIACDHLRAAGGEVVALPAHDHAQRLTQLLDLLGARRMTRVLVEGGGRLLGSLFDMREIDEWHAFVAPLVLGGEHAVSPIAGRGVEAMHDACRWTQVAIEMSGTDVHLQGYTAR